MIIAYPIAFPVACTLNKLLGHALPTMYSHSELMEIVSEHEDSEHSRIDADEVRDARDPRGRVALALERGGKVAALVGYDGGALRELASCSVVVPATLAGATSTPHVEGFHEVYHHLICERLRQLVAAS